MTGRRLDVGTLEFGGGLEILLSATLEGLKVGEVIDVITESHAVALELPGWIRLSGNATRELTTEGHGAARRYVVGVERLTPQRLLAESLPGRRVGPSLRGTEFHSGDLRGGAVPEVHADPGEGFTPLGAIREEGAPQFLWPLSDRDQIWAEDIAELTEQSSAAQWDASRDIPWQAALNLPDDVERAVAQVMTYIAQNEYAALYVPSRFLSRVNPRYVEVLMWLSSHVHDEARHVEVFTKRALIGGQPAYALASTELSLKTLLDENDFTAAALLLNVLGEGTFLDLLRFVELHAPDAATATAAKLAHRDEQRHVHFGISHVRRSLGKDPESVTVLVAAAEARTAKLASLSGLNPIVTESLTLMSALSRQPAEIAEAAASVRSLLHTMDENRVKRLRAAGFDQSTARYLSDLHTPNLM